MSDRLDVPDLDDVLALPAVLDEIVDPDHLDYNGHLNVRGYFDLHMRAWSVWFEGRGLDAGYRERERLSAFSLDHRIAYVGEVVEGERVTVHLRLTEVSDKIMRGWTAIVNRTDDTVCNVLYFVEGSVGLDSRRMEPFAEPLGSRLRAEVGDS